MSKGPQVLQEAAQTTRLYVTKLVEFGVYQKSQPNNKKGLK